MVSCITTSRSISDIIVLTSVPTAGTPPYTITFSKGSTILDTVSKSGSWPNQAGSYYYICQSTDAGQQQFTISTTDGIGQNCTDSCYVYVYNPNVAVGPNLILNPGFETSSGGLPSNWSKTQAGTPPIYTYESPGYNNTGNCVAISYPSAISNSYGRWNQVIHNLLPGHIYQSSVYMKTDSITSTITSSTYDSGAYLIIGFYYVDGTGWHYLNSIRTGMYGTTGWTPYSLSAIAPQVPIGIPYTDYIMQISLELSQSSGKVWFDNISFNDLCSINLNLSLT